MKEEEMKIKAGKPYEELTTEEKALIVDFTEEEHTELKLKYGKRLKHVTVQVDEDERYDYLIVRPKKNILLAMAKKKDDLEEANDILIRNCVAAGNMEALEDSTVYKLDEDEWLRLYAEYRMLRKTELEEFEIVMHNAFAKVVNRLFSKDNASDSMDIGTG